MEKLLQYRIYYSLADLGADSLEFVPHLLRVFQIHNVEGDLIADAFSYDPFSCTYRHAIFFDLFREETWILALRARA